jgi:hypothetical protein
MCRSESKCPNIDTVLDVLIELQDSKIDVNKFMGRKADHCYQAESSIETEVPNRDTGIGNGKQPFTILNILGN